VRAEASWLEWEEILVSHRYSLLRRPKPFLRPR
jgi:hypothetical protein